MSRACKSCEKSFNRRDKKGRLAGRECDSCLYEKRWIRNIELKYGITREKYLSLREQQNDCCAICGIHESKLTKRLCVDHCHTTGVVRGLLCGRCNIYLGGYENDPELLLVAYEYLKGGDQDL